MVDKVEDAKYIRKMKNGDRDAASYLFDKYYDKVYNYCYKRIWDREVAQDLTQDTFMKVIYSINSYKDYGKFENYLYVIAGNLCKNYYKKKKSIPFAECEEQTHKDEFEQREEQMAIRQALDSLNEVEREIITLRFYHDLKLKDIARIMNMNLSTTKYHLKKGLQEIGGRL